MEWSKSKMSFVDLPVAGQRTMVAARFGDPAVGFWKEDTPRPNTYRQPTTPLLILSLTSTAGILEGILDRLLLIVCQIHRNHGSDKEGVSSPAVSHNATRAFVSCLQQWNTVEKQSQSHMANGLTDSVSPLSVKKPTKLTPRSKSSLPKSRPSNKRTSQRNKKLLHCRTRISFSSQRSRN